MFTHRDRQHTMIIGNHTVRRLDGVRTLLVDDKEIRFTPTEYRLLLCLLEGAPVSDEELMTSVFHNRTDGDLWLREAMDRHLDNVRRKFKLHHLRMAIRRITVFGYILVPEIFPKRR